MRTLELLLLGPLEIRLGGRPVTGLTRKGSALLAYLALAERPVARPHLAAVLWDAPEATARRNLRQELYRLRRTPAGPHLTEDAEGLRLTSFRTDHARFWQRYRRGELGAALELVRGRFLEGFVLEGASGFEDWRYLEEERLKEAVVAALLRLADRLEVEDPEGATRALFQVLDWDPLLEAAYQRLFPLLVRTGRRGEAEALYRRLERSLAEELGLAPSPETARQYRAALSGELRHPRQSPSPGVLDRPPLVEREAVLAQASEGDGARWIHGPEGVGKTRLAEALAGEGALWIRFPRSLAGLPHAALVEALRPHLDRIRRLPEELRSELARLLPELGAPAGAPLTEPEARVRFFEALAQALAALARVGVLDALENADPAFLAFLPYLLRRSRTLPIRWLITSRNPPPAAWTAEGLVEAVELGPLSPRGVERLIEALSGRPSGRFAARLYQATGGNPRFVLETLKDLFASGELQAGPEGWSTPYDKSPDYLELHLPRSVREALLRRWHELSPEAIRVVRLLLLARSPADVELVARALAMDEPVAAAALLEAERAGLVTRSGNGYLPRYPELAEQIPEPLARTLHRRWAAALSETGGHPLLVAEHLAAGGRSGAAGAAYLEAARAARRGPHPAAAVVLYRRAERHLDLTEPERYRVTLERLELETELGRDTLDALLELGPPPEPDPALEARWRLAVAEAALKKGRFDLAREHAEATLARSPGESPRARARFLLAWVEYRAGDPWRQREHLEAALEAFEKAGDHRGACRVRRNLAALAFRLGDPEEGERHQRIILETLARHPDPVTRRRVWADRLTGRWLHRDYYGALAGARRLLAEARRSADLVAQMDALELIGLAEWKIGRAEEALHAFDQGLELARAVENPRELALFQSERALALMALARYGDAEAALSEARALMEELGDQAKIGHVYAAYGELHLRRGKPEEAVPWLERAVRHWEDRGEGGHAARAHALLALALADADPEAARGHARAARAHADAWRTGVPERLLVYAVYARLFPEARREAEDLLAEEAARLPPELRPYHRRTLAARLVTAG